jgi:Fe-S oxidoreductase
MLEGIYSSGQAASWLVSARTLFLVIHVLGIACFSFIVAKRLAPLLRGERDFRFNRPFTRLTRTLQFWLGQWKHPRFKSAGTIHIFIFAGFIVLAIRTFSLLILGLSDNFAVPGLSGRVGQLYDVVTDYAATIVFLCMVIAAVRRLVFKPARYMVPAKYGKGHPADAIVLLALIAIMMAADSFFAATQTAIRTHEGLPVDPLAVLSLAWAFKNTLLSTPLPTLGHLRLGACLGHEATFYFLMCYRPFGIQFHVITSIFNVYFAKLDRGTVKPVRWGVDDQHLDQVKSFGVKKFEDFTWKHMLDFYSCADCGRCSDYCPANSVGRPLSPRFISIKARDYSFQHYPVFTPLWGRDTGARATGVPPVPEHGQDGHGTTAATAPVTPLIGNIYSEDEIWSCTTCGACEEECPLLVEYIDKIVDLRRGMIEEGNVPQGLQKPLRALESRGNPYGAMDKKRADWTKAKEFRETCEVKVVKGKDGAGTLYFVDSITSYDDRMQRIGQATARVLQQAGESFGILGAMEKDSGHEVRRFGEETLFMALREHNTEAIKSTGVQRIVTNDPHAYNALKHDYKDLPPVEHISQVIGRGIKTGQIALNRVEDGNAIYAYHDPCYLGRHNQIYDDPREVLDAIPGLKRVEMVRSRDRSFCCGGGGLMLFYEPKEDQRMGAVRVKMAAEAGANVIVTACPFCMVNIEDGIKVAGLEGKMTVIDLAELVDRHMVREDLSHSAALAQGSEGVSKRETSDPGAKPI